MVDSRLDLRGLICSSMRKAPRAECSGRLWRGLWSVGQRGEALDVRLNVRTSNPAGAAQLDVLQGAFGHQLVDGGAADGEGFGRLFGLVQESVDRDGNRGAHPGCLQGSSAL